MILDSPSGPEIAYYLAVNREDAARIAQLPVHLAALEMGRIEGRLSASKEAPKAKAPVVTRAPPPVPVVDAADSSVAIKATTPESDKLSDAEWMKLREKELKRKKG